MTIPYLVFDRGKVEALKAEYEASIKFTLELLPDINWNSPSQIRNYFFSHYEINLPDVKIRTLDMQRAGYEQSDPDLFELFTGVIQLFKLKASLNNYLACILRHLDEDRLNLRDVNGIWMLPNKQPLFRNSEIWACVKSYSADLVPLIEALQTAQ